MDLEPRDPVAVGLGEPEVAVRAGSDPRGVAVGAVFGDDTGRRDLPDLPDLLGEPDVAVRAGGDPVDGAVRGDPGAVFGDDAGGRDLPDAVIDGRLGEPEVAVRP